MHRVGAQDRARQEAVLAAVLERCSDAVLQLDLAGVVEEVNAAAARLLGGDALVGQSFADSVDAEHVGQWRMLAAAAASGVPATLPAAVLRGAGGPAVHAAVSLVPVHGEDDAVVGICLVVQDHTERRLAQETLAVGEERVRRSEALAGVGSFVLDAASGYVQWSDGMHRIFGGTPASFAGTLDAHLDLVHPDDRAAVQSALDRALRERTSLELDHRAGDGAEPRWVFLAVEPVSDDDGHVIGLRGVCQDITARKSAETSVLTSLALAEKANEELRAVDALKDEFLATVSHELRTPLTSIVGFASMLTKKAPQHATLVDPIVRNGKDMMRMVEKLLDYSRLQAGKVVLQPEVTPLRPLVDRLIGTHDGADDGPVHNDVPPGLEVHTDPTALDRILGNLLDNAERYAGPGSTVRVGACTEPDGATLLTVSDDGIGIPAEHQDRLFERFFQPPGNAVRRGTGIGLAIVHEYVTRQGGRVWCESAAGAGATFFVRLPAVASP